MKVVGQNKEAEVVKVKDDLSGLKQPGLSDSEEQMQRVELARARPMAQWKAVTIQAWLEVVLAMPMYVQACSENVKSGKVLLRLTDEDLEHGLGIRNPIHFRKLRLAIEDYREAESRPGLSRAADMDHLWVCKTWLSDVGLLQYSRVFHNHLVDGRVLGSLTRHDLETSFRMSNKMHIGSVLLGIQLLQLTGFDREALQDRRVQCEHKDFDPLVWTNHRVIKWIRDIDLKEYADGLQNSGVHGAVMVLDPSFNVESMARMLGIPSNKHMLHQHLYEEMKFLLDPARANQNQCYSRKDRTPSHSPVSTCCYTEHRLPLRPNPGKSSPRFNPKTAGGQEQGFHDYCKSSPKQEKTRPRSKGSPMHAYSSTEVTNV